MSGEGAHHQSGQRTRGQAWRGTPRQARRPARVVDAVISFQRRSRADASQPTGGSRGSEPCEVVGRTEPSSRQRFPRTSSGRLSRASASANPASHSWQPVLPSKMFCEVLTVTAAYAPCGAAGNHRCRCARAACERESARPSPCACLRLRRREARRFPPAHQVDRAPTLSVGSGGSLARSRRRAAAAS